MKHLLTFLMIPLHAVMVITVLCGLACFFLTGGSAIHGTGGTAHTTRAIVQFCIFCGLLGAVISSVYGVVMTVLGFILKSWRRGLLSAGIAALSVFLWRYFLTQPYFFE